MKPWKPTQEEIAAAIDEELAPTIDRGHQRDASYRDASNAALALKGSSDLGIQNIFRLSMRARAMWKLYEAKCRAQEKDIATLTKELAKLRRTHRLDSQHKGSSGP